MAEAAGLALGIAGLIGTFQACLELFDRFSALKSLDRDCRILETKLDIERTLLLQWAERVQLIKQNPHESLNDPATRAAVSRLLENIDLLLSEGQDLYQRYGVRSFEPEKYDPPLPHIRDLGEMTLSSSRMLAFSYDIMNRKPAVKRGARGLDRIRWVITDRERFEKLVQDLSYFVSSLDRLFANTPQSASLEPCIPLLTQDIDSMMNEDDLRHLRDVASSIENRRLIADAADERLIRMAQQRILRLLWFRVIDDRRHSIREAHSSTFKWALEDSHLTTNMEWDNLPKWLRSGEGIYWLSGKAGSGKSTLMKYLYNNEKCQSLLSPWAGKIPLSVESFFLWNLGSTEQKSQPGLTRAIFYKILSAAPTAIPILFPALWRESYQDGNKGLAPPTDAEMQLAINNLEHYDALGRRFCFFIDGLDEYSGDYNIGIEFVKRLCSNHDIKIVLSSRPVPACENAFSRLPKLRLQDLTIGDITKYVHDNVGAHPYMDTLRQENDERANAILNMVIEKASGVFLWVVLACQSVVKGFAGYDRLGELEKRVLELPEELKDLFTHMLSLVEARYHSQAARLFCLLYRIQKSKRYEKKRGTLCTLGLAIVEVNDMSLQNFGGVKDITVQGRYKQCELLEGRLRSRCGGLLEIVRGSRDARATCFCGTSLTEAPRTEHDTLVDSTVEFLHRTVYEFLDDESTWSLQCLHLENAEFDANAVLSLISWHQCQLSLSLRARTERVEEDLADAILYAIYADRTSPDFVKTMMFRVKDAISRIRKRLGPRFLDFFHFIDRNIMPWGPPTLDLLVFSISAGMINFSQRYLESQLPSASLKAIEEHFSFTWLQLAVDRSWLSKPFKEHFDISRHLPTSNLMVKHLLCSGCRQDSAATKGIAYQISELVHGLQFYTFEDHMAAADSIEYLLQDEENIISSEKEWRDLNCLVRNHFIDVKYEINSREAIIIRGNELIRLIGARSKAPSAR